MQQLLLAWRYVQSANGEQRQEQLTVLVVREEFSEGVTFELAGDQDVGVFQGEKV